MSIVSDIKGTTTDTVKKSMELLPIGPVLIIDTPGFDDEGELGEKRVNATKKILQNCDIAVLVTEADRNLNDVEKGLISVFKDRNIPYIIAKNKADILKNQRSNEGRIIYTSAVENIGIEELKITIGKSVKSDGNELNLVSDLIKPKDIVILVTPIDSAAPKNRLILPQQLAIRDIIDIGAIPIVTKETELDEVLNSLKKEPALVITDSQVFDLINKIVPKNILLTSFSILMARYKGFLTTAFNGVKKISKLDNDSKILISEGCTHHRQCDDIGTVKLPKMLNEFSRKKLNYEWTSGLGFPDDLSKYDLIIHCGGCMLNSNEMKFRMNKAIEQNVAFTNYGIAIAYMKGILERSMEVFR